MALPVKAVLLQDTARAAASYRFIFSETLLVSSGAQVVNGTTAIKAELSVAPVRLTLLTSKHPALDWRWLRYACRKSLRQFRVLIPVAGKTDKHVWATSDEKRKSKNYSRFAKRGKVNIEQSGARVEGKGSDGIEWRSG